MKRALGKLFRLALGLSGALAFLFVILSFTDVPYLAYHRLGTSSDTLQGTPDLIVLLGGGGMPSPDGLMRCYYAAEAALRFPGVPVILALPANADGSLRQLDLMARELMLKGVDSSRIRYEPLGFNTHSQAVNIASEYGVRHHRLAVLVVTSPEHIYRAVRVFLKTGFAAGGMPAFEKPVDEEKAMGKEKSGDRRVRNVSLRYNMWSYMNYELLVLREYLAIGYYRWKGWI